MNGFRIFKIGLLKDKTQSWTIPFALVGVTMIFGGLVAGIIPLYTCYKKKKTKSKNKLITVK
jgi:Na+/citrate or Na+/malate symporter